MSRMSNAIPGPNSTEWGKRREEAVPRAVFNTVPIFVAGGEGAELVDVDGNRFIDLAGGLGVLTWAGPTPGARGRPGTGRDVPPRVLPRRDVRGVRRARRGAEPADAGRPPEEDDARELGSRSRRERGEDRPLRDRARCRHRVHQRVPRTNADGHDAHRQGDALQARLRSVRARGLPGSLRLLLPLPPGPRTPDVAGWLAPSTRPT